MEKFETPPDSPPITVIDPDDQFMWSNTRTVAPTPSFAIIQLLISNNFYIKDDPTQGILDAGGIFLYNTPNEVFKILEDKVLLKLDFSKDSQNILVRILKKWTKSKQKRTNTNTGTE
ncbi:hypothetical protein Tco_1366951 [Tanacetum coccineum]